jgi:protein SCO1
MRRLLAAFLALAVVAAGAAILLRPDSKAAPTERYRGSAPPAGLSLPSFSLRDAVSGAAVRSADLRGRVVLVTFLDTRCKEACPVIAGQIASALRLLTATDRARVATVALTVNPRVDTRAHVRAFLAERRATGLIRYLTGTRAQLDPVWKAFHVLPATDTGDDDVHSADVRVFDPRLRWVSTLHTSIDLTPANLAHDVRLALRS